MGARDIVVQEYLDLLDRQRETTFAALAGLREEDLWRRPAPREWCIGEIIDHTRLLNLSFMPICQSAWWLNKPLAAMRRGKPYPTEIDDVYHRPGFPMWVGFLWPPKYRPEKRIPIRDLISQTRSVHDRYREFFTGKDSDLLGQMYLYDPVIGRVNLIQILRIGAYHDELHFVDVRKMAAEMRKSA